jgi:hypothetical protein
MKLLITALLLVGLAACGTVQTASLSPNDPGYWYGGAPQYVPQVRAPGNERTYRPLGRGGAY